MISLGNNQNGHEMRPPASGRSQLSIDSSRRCSSLPQRAHLDALRMLSVRSSHRGHHVDTTLVQHNVQIRHHARSPFRINRNLGGRRNLNPRPQPRHAAGSVSFREAGERAPRSEMGALPSAPCDAECPLLRSPLGPVYARLGSIPAIPLGGIKRVILTTRDSSKSSAPSRSSKSPRWYEADCNEGGRAAPPMARP